MIAPLFNNSVHGDVLMRRDWIDTCLKYISGSEVKNIIDMVRHITLGVGAQIEFGHVMVANVRAPLRAGGTIGDLRHGFAR